MSSDNSEFGRSILLWEKTFRFDARSNKNKFFIDHMLSLGLPNKPKLMLEGTIRVIRAIAGYTKSDELPFDVFLAMQRYDLSKSSGVKCIFTFDLCDKAFARVLIGEEKPPLDLADLFNHPWSDYKVAGYCSFWISHPDWSPLIEDEINQLEEIVKNDLYFDYDDDELSVWFEVGADNSFIFAGVQDREIPIELDSDNRYDK